MLIPGLSGCEGRVRRHLAERLSTFGIESRTDRIGNLIASVEGTQAGPSVMLFAHTDQIGFFVRRVEPNGFIRVERVGGIPEKTLPATSMLLCVGEGRDVPGVFGCKSNHVTPESEKYTVQPYIEQFIDAGFTSAEAAMAAGVQIGTPAIYAPRFNDVAENCVAGTAIDDRAGCAVILEVAKALDTMPNRPTVHLVFAVQEEFNVRGAMVAAQALKPDIAIQLDVAIACDTPDLAGYGDVALGCGPAMSTYNFHGRGTLNGLIPHPALVQLISQTASDDSIPIQPAAVVGALTDNSYVQFVGEGVACIDLGVPCRYTHSPNELASVTDMEHLARLLTSAISRIGPQFVLDRDQYIL